MITTSEPRQSPALQGIDTPIVETRDLSFYRRALMPHLNQSLFRTNPLRLVWFSACLVGMVLFGVGIIHGATSWPLKLILSIGLGVCNGLLGFLSHELLHGSVVKSQRVQMFLGFFGLMPFLISPTYWKFVHNRLHHGQTQKTIRDPDAFPTLRVYKASRFVQAIFPFTPGSGYLRSGLYFFFWLSFHEFVAQIYLRFRNGVFVGMDQRRVTLELGAQLVIAAALAVYAGPSNWLWLFIIPLAVQNYLLMSYISTNHNLSPLTDVNDPLLNSLTVTNHPALEFFTFNFGYHVEHHLFPAMSGKHTKKVHALLKEKFPDTYKYMPKWQAIRQLYRTPRIYKNSHELIHPETMKTYKTL